MNLETPSPLRLGTVTCPSGTLLLFDGGLAWMWSHDKAPLLPPHVSFAAKANSARDLVLRGPDAMAAGRLFQRSCHPLYLYDRPPEAVDSLSQAFEALVAEHGFDAHIEVLEDRVPHRRRVDLVLAALGGAGTVEFNGIWMIALGGVPRDQPLAVMGEPMPPGPDEGRWRRVWIELRPGETARTAEIGTVLVDEARLMAVDANALGHWNDRNSLDGLADLVFWGRDAELVAAEVGAARLDIPGEADVFGWQDLPVAEAVERGHKVEEHGSEIRKFHVDFRPHTHHWQVMRDVRAGDTDSGTLDLAGGRLTMFMTRWGDGAFPVDADFDAEGRPLRLRVELGCESIVKRQRAMEERYFGAFAKLALVTARVARDGLPVLYVHREAPDHERDSGWRLYHGDESDAYLDDADNALVLPLRDLIDRDRTLEAILRTEGPCAFAREDAASPFQPVEGI